MSIFDRHPHHPEPMDELIETLVTLYEHGRLSTVEELTEAVGRLAEPGRPLPHSLHAHDEHDVGHVLRRAREESRRAAIDAMESLRVRGRAGILILPPVPPWIVDRVAGDNAITVHLIEAHGRHARWGRHPHLGHPTRPDHHPGHPRPDDLPHPDHPHRPDHRDHPHGPDHPDHPGHGGHPGPHPPGHPPNHEPHHSIAARLLDSRAAKRMLVERRFKVVLLDGFRLNSGALVRAEIWDFLYGVPDDCSLAIHARPTRFPDDDQLDPALAGQITWI